MGGSVFTNAMFLLYAEVLDRKDKYLSTAAVWNETGGKGELMGGCMMARENTKINKDQMEVTGYGMYTTSVC